MSLYRGAGGASDATDDSTVNAVAGYASAAASSASAAATSATNASNSATAAASSASGAASSASSVATNAANASSSAGLANTYATAASNSKDAAAASAVTASTKAGEASTSASNAATSASTATTKASEAATSATNAANSASASASSAASALAIYGNTAAVNAAVAASAASATSSAAYANEANQILSYVNSSRDEATAAADDASAWASASQASANSAAASAVALGNEPVRHSVRPSLLLDFANTKTLDPRITFTRASEGRFYDGKTVAKAEENLLLRSQEFDNASWAKTRTTVTANAIAAPDGTTSADAVYETVDTNTHYVNQAITPNGQAYTISVFAKGGLGRGWVWIRTVVGGPAERTAFFDVTNGVVGNVGSGLTASITSVGGGWYRCVVSTTNSSTTIDAWGFGPASANGTSNYAGDITKGIYIWGAQLEQRSSVTAYTPTTTAPITNYIPALQTAAAGVPRFDHNPVTGESLGLLIEEQRTNLLTYSEDLSNAVWSTVGSTVSANATVAPDGTLTADLIIPTTSSAQHGVNRTITSQGSPFAISVYAKKAGYDRLTIATSNLSYSVFDLTNGTATGYASIGVTERRIQDVGNGWYRCTVIGSTATGTTIGFRAFNASLPSGDPVFTGDGFSGIYIWGAQLEAGAFATSYIPTVASQVTRSADAASMTGTNFSSWYRADEGTLYSESTAFVAAGFSRAMQISDGTTTNFISATTNTSHIRNGGVFQTSLNTPGSGVVAGVFYKVALGYKVDDIAASTNGAATLTDSSATLPSASRLQIGGETSSAGSNGNIKKLAYYPKRLTNAELQGLTTV